MCGFVGGNKLHSIEETELCLNKIIHRGRDYTGTFQDKELFLGHNRLSIQDTSSNANQPFISNSGDIVITYSGELWAGYQDLKEKHLPNYQFRTNSDTEVIVALYEKYGTDSFKLLDGMYSLCIFDKRIGKLFLVRDWIGKIPFYYFKDSDSNIIFSNEMKAFSHLKDVQDKFYLIFEVQPACYLEYDLKSKQLKNNKYYTLPYSEEYGGRFDLKDSPEVIAHNIRDKLDNAVRKRLISDEPICALLSGGIDSVVITYLAKKYLPNIEAFTVSCYPKTNTKDDLYYAHLAARELGVKLNPVELNAHSVIRDIDKTIYAIEDDKWTQLSTAIVQIPLAEVIGKAGYKVAIGGEGADEIFASYADVEAYNYSPEAYHKKRKQLIDGIHNTNLRRTNCAMLFGGTVEMRSPFLDRDFVEYCVRIPAHYAWRIRNKDPKRVKPLLREAFKDVIQDSELLYRKKVPTGEGANITQLVKNTHNKDKNYFSRRLNQLLFGKE